MSGGKWALGYEARIFGLALLTGAPGVMVSLLLLFRESHTLPLRWGLAILLMGAWLGFSVGVRDQVVRRLQTIANLLAALREGDFSIRGRRAEAADALDSTLREVNALADTLQQQRLGAVEAGALLTKVMSEIDVAIFAFDRERRLRLVNRAGGQLLGRPPEQLIGMGAQALGMAALLEGEPERTVDATFLGARGQWELRRGSFRQNGLPHELLVLTDLQRALRQEERQAWQRMVRVLGHEINNSMAPIQSIAGNLEQLMQRQPRPADCEEDVVRGLRVVERRAEALGRFMRSYAKLAKLPPPKFAPVDVAAWIRRIAELEERVRVAVAPGPQLSILGDGDQLDQLLINLLQNATDATLETGGAVSIGWQRTGRQVEVVISDEGPGVGNTTNLFVPFFTTKPNGSGIGLVLSRQIAEAHHGSLDLRNREDRTGCEAVLRLPI